LPTLRKLRINDCNHLTGTTAFEGSGITELTLGSIPANLALAGLADMPELRSLTLSSTDAVPLPTALLPQVTSLALDTALDTSKVPAIGTVFPGLQLLVLRLTRRPYRAAVDVSTLRGILHAQITIVDAGRIEGRDLLDPDQATVTVEGRRTGGLLRRFRE
jgi:hypothetical protein